MKIELILKSGKKVAEFELPSNPFMAGEEIDIKIKNHERSNWNREDDINQKFKIISISHSCNKDYYRNHKKTETFAITAIVEPISD